MLAERCALLSAEILKSQGKYSETATLLIKMTSEVRNMGTPLASCPLHVLQWHSVVAGCPTGLRFRTTEDFISPALIFSFLEALFSQQQLQSHLTC